MGRIFHYILLAAMLLLIVYVAVGPGAGVLFASPLATVGLGLIGLGLCRQHREAAAKAHVEPVKP